MNFNLIAIKFKLLLKSKCNRKELIFKIDSYNKKKVKNKKTFK